MLRSRRLAFLLVAVTLLAGCTWMWLESEEAGQRKGVSSSLVDFLYPEGQVPPEYAEAIPELKLPLRAGVAFVPSAAEGEAALDEVTRQQLLETVKARFESRDYIAGIEVIPEQYMRARRGFQTLDQVARLYALDVIALVSYDQTSFTGDTPASFWYWTIVGAYVVKGSRNDVDTFLDIAVFDVPTHKLLMRAPGTSRIEAKTTAVEIGEELRENRIKGFRKANEDMTNNLEDVLDQFEARVKAREPTGVVIAHREGHGGGAGAGGPAFLLLLLLAQRRRSPRA
jgi:rhombotail lipoprotein